MIAAHHLDDETLTRRWLGELYGDAEGWLTLFALDRRNGQQQVVWRPAEQLADLAAEAARMSDHSCVWFGVAPRRERVKGRGSAADCVSLPGLWLDIDVAGPNHKGGQPLPATTDDALSLLDAFPLPPSAVVSTGGGIQAWWLFREPLAVDEGTGELLARWGHTWAQNGKQRGWHVDNVFDLARIMRLPGTVNHKSDPTPCEILTVDYARRYNADDLDQFTLELPAAPPQPVERLPYIGPERPGDAFNATKRGGDVLGTAGFRLGRRDQNGDEHWTGPWKDTREGSSATVYADGHTTIWSDTALERWPHLELRRPYDPFGLYCALFHDGDWTAAGAELSRLGYGSRNVADDFSWVGPAAATEDEDDWDAPLPIGAPEPDPFPLDVLPGWMANECAAVAERLQVPVDLCGQIVLGAWAAVCMGHVKVRVTDTYETHVNLYLATAMPSGAGKSPADKALGTPLRELAEQVKKDSRHTVAEAKARKSILEKKRQQAERDGDMAEMTKLFLEIDDHRVPEPRRLIADDATPEVLTQLLDRHGGRIAIVSTEAALLDVACGAYASNRTVNLDVYLKGWAGERLVVDRKGSGERQGTEIDIPEALLTIAVTVQPSALEALKKNRELFGRGFIPRFMYCLPQHNVGRRERGRLLEQADVESTEDYRNEFLRLGLSLQRWELPITLRFAPETARRFIEWQQEIEPMLADEAELEPLREWVAKMQGTVPRVAGLLHVADDKGHDEALDVATLERAIRLAEYWKSHALRVLDLWEMDEIASLARLVVRQRFEGEGITEFTQRDIYVWMRRRLEKAAEHRDTDVGDVAYLIVRFLVDRGYARNMDGAPVRRAQHGEARQQYVVNPHCRRSIARIARTSIDGGSSSSIYTNSLQTPPSPPTPPESARNARNNGAGVVEASYSAPDEETSPPARPVGWLIAEPTDCDNAS